VPLVAAWIHIRLIEEPHVLHVEVSRQFAPGGVSPAVRARRSAASAKRRRASACSEARWSSRMRAGLVGRGPYALALYKS